MLHHCARQTEVDNNMNAAEVASWFYFEGTQMEHVGAMMAMLTFHWMSHCQPANSILARGAAAWQLAHYSVISRHCCCIMCRHAIEVTVFNSSANASPA
jgi:hypothetical protein